MRAAIFGGEGMLGRDLVAAFGRESFGLTHGEADICDPAAVARALDERAPDAAVIAAAFHDVPRCEREPQTAYAVNVLGALHVARACAARRLPLVYVSSDYVFSGETARPYVEDDLPAPLSVYGASKAAGEMAVLAAHPAAQVVRTSGLFGTHPCRAKGGRNIVDFLRARLTASEPLKMVADEYAAPTSTADLATQIRRIVEAGGPGIYHAVNTPGCSWFELALEVKRQLGSDLPVEPVEAAAFPSPVRKPRRSTLACARLEREGLLAMRPLSEALADYLAAVSAAA